MRGAGDYTYALPPELVAQDPPATRGDSWLLVVDRQGVLHGIHPFADLPAWLAPGDLLVRNDSRVLPARLWTRREDSGGRVELLLVEPVAAPAGAWLALARPVRRLRAGLRLMVTTPSGDATAGPSLELVARREDGAVVVTAVAGEDLVTVADTVGEAPLPPYIRRDPADPHAAERRLRDRDRYQTVYARRDRAGTGSVAAPTAGLHFAEALLDRLAERGVAVAAVTLHVGPGTFRPPSAAQVAARRLHAERFELSPATAAAVADCRARGGRVVAVGTTSLRVLETVQRLALPAAAPTGATVTVAATPADPAPVFQGTAVRTPQGWRVEGSTRLFIQPPDRPTAADGLVTNFHLPGSSLLMLVAAFAGDAAWRAAYAAAIAARLRFFSYGDAMLIAPAAGEAP